MILVFPYFRNARNIVVLTQKVMIVFGGKVGKPGYLVKPFVLRTLQVRNVFPINSFPNVMIVNSLKFVKYGRASSER